MEVAVSAALLLTAPVAQLPTTALSAIQDSSLQFQEIRLAASPAMLPTA